jgi:hypothetical protein
MTTSLRTSADEANVGNARCQVSARTTDKRSGCKQGGGSSICEHNVSLAHLTYSLLFQCCIKDGTNDSFT